MELNQQQLTTMLLLGILLIFLLKNNNVKPHYKTAKCSPVTQCSGKLNVFNDLKQM